MRNLIIPLLMAIFMASGICLAQEAASPQDDNGTMTLPATQTDEGQNQSMDQNATLSQNITEAQNATPQEPAVPNLVAIWSVDGIEQAPGIIMMMLDQDGQDLFGAAKYEPEGGQPWNAVVVGSVEGDKVYLAITALEGGEQVSSMLAGTITELTFGDKTIDGKFFTVTEGKISKQGDFRASIALPDISGYEPANIEEPKVEVPETPAQTSEQNVATTVNQTAKQPVQLSSRFTPVESLKDKYYGVSAGLLSEVPIGMEGNL
jgi:hypothetical protein